MLTLRGDCWWVRRAAEAARARVWSCAPPGIAPRWEAPGSETQIMAMMKLCPDQGVTSGHRCLPETPSTIVLLLRKTLNRAQRKFVIV